MNSVSRVMRSFGAGALATGRNRVDDKNNEAGCSVSANLLHCIFWYDLFSRVLRIWLRHIATEIGMKGNKFHAGKPI